MADGNDNRAGNNNHYRRMLEAQLNGRSLDDILKGNTEEPPGLELIKKIKTDNLIIKPASILPKKAEKVLPELPSEFEQVLLFSPPFDSWKPFGQGAIVKMNNILYACPEENTTPIIFTGKFTDYVGYGRGALVGNWAKDEDLRLDTSAYLCPLPPAESFNIRFPNTNMVIPLSSSELAVWQQYAEGIIGLVHKFRSYRLTKYSDKKTTTILAKIPNSREEIGLFPSWDGAIVRTGTRVMLYQEANREAIELYRGGWSDVRSWGDDLIVRIGREITRYSAGKESKLLYRGEGTDWKMTGCGLLVNGEDGQLNLITEEDEDFSFKGNIEKIAGYPLGMLWKMKLNGFGQSGGNGIKNDKHFTRKDKVGKDSCGFVYFSSPVQSYGAGFRELL